MLTEPGLADTLGLWRGNPEAAALVFPPLRCGFEITAKNRESLLRDITALLVDQVYLSLKRPGKCLRRRWQSSRLK